MDADMLDENRIRLMTKLAICEKKGIEKDIQISGYYKKDYASLKKMDYADRDHNRIWTGSSIICSMCIRYVIRGSYVYKAGIAGCDRGRSLSCVTDFVWNRGWIFL